MKLNRIPPPSNPNPTLKLRIVVLQLLPFTAILYCHIILPYCTAILYFHIVPPYCTSILYRHTVLPYCTAILYRHTVLPNCTSILYRHTVPPNCTSKLYRHGHRNATCVCTAATPRNRFAQQSGRPWPNTCACELLGGRGVWVRCVSV
jgi:hypothetical protein